MEGETPGAKSPEKDDMDALEVQPETEGGNEAVLSAEEQSESGALLERAVRKSLLSDGQVRALSGDLYSKAIFKREDGARIIWNAFGNLSLSPGLHMKIEGKDYETQGVIQDKHLVMGCSMKKE
jgi:hypothetical protein